ncbi:MAG: acyl-CoA dehydrogenase family protein [Alphaproteobacteria bacterium]|nr:acyl-CoA dehydrogenase family protein [Alphaproteobacteria bacterium]
MADRSFLDWPFFSDRHRDLAETVERWAADTLPAFTARAHTEDTVADATRDLVAQLAKGGWLRHAVPTPYGFSQSLDVRSLCLIRETLARHLGLADFAFAMQGLGSAPVSMFGSPAQRDALLPGIADGTKIGAFALSEPGAGSNPADMITRAQRDGDHYVLNGEKTWISNAGIATQYTVFARTGEDGAKGLSAFVVSADAPGFSVAEKTAVIAPHPLGRLVFNDCRVPADSLIGNEGDGFKIAMATLDTFRSSVGAAALGFARRALDETLNRVSERHIGGTPLADYQMTQSRIADMALSIDAAALLIYRAAWTKDSSGARISREAAMAKLHATEMAQQVIDSAVQLHGGLGVVSGSPVEVLYREIRSLRIYVGTSEIQKIVIAQQTLRNHAGQSA